MGIKLLALDLDGTLLDEKSRLPEANRMAVQKALAAGVEVVLVTGRSWRGSREYYEAMGLTGPAICYMGALVVADGTGRITSHLPLVPEAWERLRDFALAEGLPVTACAGVEYAVAAGVSVPSGDNDVPVGARGAENLVAADTAYATCRADDFRNWDDWNPYTQIVPDLAPCKAAPIMLAVYGEKAARRVLAAFPDGLPDSQFDVHDHVAGEVVLHIWNQGVNKREALLADCNRRGISAAEVAAIGDMPMDVGMITFAGIGVAVPGAHPQVRSAADWVMTPSEAIEKILAEGL